MGRSSKGVKYKTNCPFFQISRIVDTVIRFQADKTAPTQLSIHSKCKRLQHH